MKPYQANLLNAIVLIVIGPVGLSELCRPITYRLDPGSFRCGICNFDPAFPEGQ